MSWSLRFESPIAIDGRKLVTLRDAGEYISALPKKMQSDEVWQTATEMLLQAAQHGGQFWLTFARLGMMQAIHRPTMRPESDPSKDYVYEFQNRKRKDAWR